MKMDIKKLLLMQQVIPIVRFMCLKVHKKRYSIQYVVKDNILTVENIKRIRKRQSLNSRLKLRKQNFIRKLMRHRAQAIRRSGSTPSDSTPDKPKVFQDIGVCTNRVEVRNVYTAASVVSFHQCTSTRRLEASNARIQTEVFTSSISTQCQIPVHARSSQTDNMQISMSTQTDALFTLNRECQTDIDDCANVKELRGNFEDVSNMLTEVSQMVLHQNKLINNNCTMLGHLSEITLLNKFADNQKEAEKLAKSPTMLTHWRCRYMLPRPKRRCIYTKKHMEKTIKKQDIYTHEEETGANEQESCTKLPEITVICIDAWQQTDAVEVQHKLTQTTSKVTFFPGFFKHPSSTRTSQEAM